MAFDDAFEVVIGLEIHAQISTKTKLFCRCDNNSFDKEPNVNVCPVCMGFPGQLPVLNEEALDKGIKAALALGCEIPEFSKFDRKQYFYPDLPTGFQISQYDQPLSEKGEIEIEVNGEKKKIRITRLHLENDAGKLTHVPASRPGGEPGTLCDYNRAGSPLMEIVSEPDLRSPEEAVAYAKEIQSILRYVGSSDADMEKGMMRFDASVSIREKGGTELNPRAEIKNLNSFRFLEAAIKYEIKRQIELWNEGQPLKGDQTVGWVDDQHKTVFLRDKEGADDYRYFPEPDLPPVIVKKEVVAEYKANLPELPAQKRSRYLEEFKLLPDDARILADDLRLSQYFEAVVAECDDPKKAVSFVNTVLMKFLKEDGIGIEKAKVDAAQVGRLIALINKGDISNNQAKSVVFEEMYMTGKDPEVIVEEKGLKQVSDEGALKEACEKVMAEFPQAVEDFKNGKDRALGMLVGQVMKATRGQANPQKVNEILRELIA